VLAILEPLQRVVAAATSGLLCISWKELFVMTPLRTLLLVLAPLVLVPSHVWADSSISFGCGKPLVFVDGDTITISAEGTYTLDGCATLKSVTLYAVLSDGGQGGQDACTASSGSWSNGDITLSGLAPGTYTLNIYARLYVTVASEDQFYDTPVDSRQVTIGGGK
jgi:hypothetical protein